VIIDLSIVSVSAITLNFLSLVELFVPKVDDITREDNIFGSRMTAKGLFDKSGDEEVGPLELVSSQKSKEETTDNVEEASALSNCK